MIHTSEFVTVGHPDRLADGIGGAIINEIYHKDGPSAHAAIEVSIFGGKKSSPTIIVGGEATTSLPMTGTEAIEYWSTIIKKVVSDYGYTKENQDAFGKENVLCFNDYDIQFFVNPQSLDIAQGVGPDKGWNDQGIYFNYAEKNSDSKLGYAFDRAKALGEHLFELSKGFIDEENIAKIGPDIKTLVTVDDDHNILAVTVAAPVNSKKAYDFVVKETKEFLNLTDSCNLIVNGTGAYVAHGTIADSGLTGRKIVCSGGGTGGYAPHGGGSAIKPPHASDRMLPLFARYIAKAVVTAFDEVEDCTVAIGGAIGQKHLQSFDLYGTGITDEIKEKVIAAVNTTFPEISPKVINNLFNSYNTDFNSIVACGFISEDYENCPWENVTSLVDTLKSINNK